MTPRSLVDSGAERGPGASFVGGAVTGGGEGFRVRACPRPLGTDTSAPFFLPVPCMTIKVDVRSNESLEAALRRFKRQCNYGGVFRLAKASTWHEKRSDKRRRERRERMRTILKAARRARWLLNRS